MKAIAAALSAAALLASCASGAPPSPPSASMPAATSSALSLVPKPTLAGEIPGPDATVPPGAAVLSDLRLQEVADLWASLGLSCLSRASGGPESTAGYNVHCESTDLAVDVDVVAEADYWTADGLVSMSVSLIPSGIDSIDPRAAANEWVFPFARLTGGDAAVAWVQAHIDDRACHQGCTEGVRGSRLSYYSGSRGGQELFFEALRPLS